jgi:lysozyme
MRREIFDAIKAARGDKGYSTAEVALVDALLDQLGVSRGTSNGAIAVADALTREFEGCKLTAYPDPGSGGDPWTIGWGATGAGIHKGVVWTQAQADARHVEDLERFAAGVNKLIGTAETTDKQRGAMISLAYNIGLGNFGSSTLLLLHKAGDYPGAKAQFARWNRAAGKVMAGLTRRRAAEAAVYGS